MNNNIEREYLSLEEDRVLQIRKLVCMYGRAMSSNSSRISALVPSTGTTTISFDETQFSQ